MMATTLSPERLHSAARKEASWVVGACRQFFANRCPEMAASIAFYSAFSLAPTLVMVIAVAGWFFGADAARGELFHQVHKVLGDDAAAAITTILANAYRAGNASGIATLISLSILVVGASATFSSLHSALNVVWPPDRTRTSSVLSLMRARLVSFSLVLGVAFLLIVSLVLDTAVMFVGRWLLGNSPFLIIGNPLQLAVGLVVLTIAFAALLHLLPDAKVPWRNALVGGIVAAVLFSTGKKLFAFYLAHAGMATAFGAAGSLAVLLMWLYFSAAVLLLGAEFAAARARLHDPRGAWGFLTQTQPGCRAKLASVLAASTIAKPPERQAAPGPAPSVPIGNTVDGAGEVPVSAARESGQIDAPSETLLQATAPGNATKTQLAQRDGAGTSTRHTPGERMEDGATYAAALTLVHAGRTVVAADRYVKRHPWRSVLLAAGAAIAMTTAAGRRRGKQHGTEPVDGQTDSPSAR
ncbi:YhjD/YihY/BrkB family envelope integrity protein [Paraburkholderia adhaesiva]|uniref:YhjD/YihY/BrkB family envelope integrity protein n=1 Tax=Paraburkholderia adhaesiva TaxID=2883244 RepID=UPI0040329F35